MVTIIFNKLYNFEHFAFQPFTLPPGVHSSGRPVTMAPSWNSKLSASNQHYQQRPQDHREYGSSTNKQKTRSSRSHQQTRSSTNKHLPATTIRPHVPSTNKSSTRKSSRGKATNQKASHKPWSLFFVVVGVILLGLASTGLAVCRDFHYYILTATAILVSLQCVLSTCTIMYCRQMVEKSIILHQIILYCFLFFICSPCFLEELDSGMMEHFTTRIRYNNYYFVSNVMDVN